MNFICIVFNLLKLLVMKKKKRKDERELSPLNESLLDRFSVEKLEERLETDPLLIGQLLGSIHSGNNPTDANSGDEGCCFFGSYYQCGEKGG